MEASDSDATVVMTPSSSCSDSQSDSTFTFAIPPEVPLAQGIVADLQNRLRQFDGVLDSLYGQTMHIGLLGDNIMPSSKGISDIRKSLVKQEEEHAHGIKEIELILEEFLRNQIIEDMEKQIEQEIEQEIDQLVAAEVEKCIAMHLPAELQEEVAKQRRELEDLRQQLHNSESRRANSLLRSTDKLGKLHTIYMPNGTISEHFPSTLKELFELGDGPCKALVQHYLGDPSKARDSNLNRFMQFCGVTYAMVRDGHGTARRVGHSIERARSC
ncbi:hypothetical protein C8J56DRAFT_968760 [Mycena floridula]|nr:hypothetical protein C8J56DRAFT_968760 [Mycena floridula]